MSRSINPNLIQKWTRENPKLVVNLKCKACTKFVKEIERLPTQKDVGRWI